MGLINQLEHILRVGSYELKLLHNSKQGLGWIGQPNFAFNPN
jgi:hypothetical protein